MPALLNDTVAAFIHAQRHFYLGSANAKGEPYVQHRGGPPGFLRVLDETTLGFADFAGNRRYVSVGNIGENPNVFLFLMDYPARRRLKIRGTAAIATDPALIRTLAPGGTGGVPAHDAVVERAIVIRVTHWETNCDAHITPRWTQAEVDAAAAARTQSLEARVAELERRLAGAGLATD